VVTWISDGEKKKNNVIDCNIKLLSLNSKKLPAIRKKAIVCRMSSDTAHWYRPCPVSERFRKAIASSD